MGLSDATIELRGTDLSAWRGSTDALTAKLRLHYLTQLKQWTFTLISAASPSLGLFKRRKDKKSRRVDEARSLEFS